ncbi:MAG TPA: hypothetical protein VFC53_04150, partial [Dehalococcoidia bacterium]|nr:hypothetical protein [Dehalococcoidia bacterium]
PCSTCGGSGVVENPDWQVWGADARAAGLPHRHSPACMVLGDPSTCRVEEEFLEQHPEPDGPEEIRCGECDGVGSRPTDAGRALLGFLLARGFLARGFRGAP